MGNFNEIQKGIPDLGKTYWNDLKQNEAKDNSLAKIVEVNCRTIFDSPEDIPDFPAKPSIFNE